MTERQLPSVLFANTYEMLFMRSMFVHGYVSFFEKCANFRRSSLLKERQQRLTDVVSVPAFW